MILNESIPFSLRTYRLKGNRLILCLILLIYESNLFLLLCLLLSVAVSKWYFSKESFRYSWMYLDALKYTPSLLLASV